MPSVIIAVCVVGIVLGAAVLTFAAVTRKKGPAFFSVIMGVVGILSMVSSVLILIGVITG